MHSSKYNHRQTIAVAPPFEDAKSELSFETMPHAATLLHELPIPHHSVRTVKPTEQNVYIMLIQRLCNDLTILQQFRKVSTDDMQPLYIHSQTIL